MGCDLCANRRCPSNPNFAPLGRTLFFLIPVQQGLRDKHQLSRAIRSAALPPDLASEPQLSPRTSKTSLRQATPNVSRSGSTGACSLRVSTALRLHCLDLHRSVRLRPLVSFTNTAPLSLRAVCDLHQLPQHSRCSVHWGS